ncbi:MAG: rane protein [Bacteroidetes bacterium]|nr:rane protein [Bacteroidota bacterium]
MQVTNRLLALDVMRGITIAGMILVNNPGSWGHIFTPLEHASWNGLTPTDLVFPFFMFIMGVSTYFSLRKYDFRFSSDAVWKILRRTLVIFGIGLAIGWFGLLCRTTLNFGNTEMTFSERLMHGLMPFDKIRALGVMQRLALSYCGASLLILLIDQKKVLYVAGGILIAYLVVLLVGNGFDLSENNVINVVDRALFGVNHIYKDVLPDGSSIAFDPEGLLSTLPCLAHVLLGFYVGKIINSVQDNGQRIQQIFIFGTILLFAGFLLSYGCPINKKVWSPSFVMVTCGLGSLLLSLLIWLIDIKGYARWSHFFESFGINPLFMYVLGAFLSILLSTIPVSLSPEVLTIKGFVYNDLLLSWLPDLWASLVYAILFVLLNWSIGHILYRKQLYIKI